MDSATKYILTQKVLYHGAAQGAAVTKVMLSIKSFHKTIVPSKKNEKYL